MWLRSISKSALWNPYNPTARYYCIEVSMFFGFYRTIWQFLHHKCSRK